MTTTRAEQALEDAYQRGMETKDAQEAVRAKVRDALAATVRGALSAGGGFVPVAWRQSLGGGIGSETIDSAMYDILGHDEEMAALLQVLSRSQCPLVADLRERFVARVVADRADDIADLEIFNE